MGTLYSTFKNNVCTSANMLSNTVTLLLACTYFTTLAVADDAVVVLKASSAIDVPALKNVQGTVAVYRVKRLNFYSNAVYKGKYNPPGEYVKTEWNYVVLGKGFANAAAKKVYMNKIASFSFVEEHSSIGLTVNPHFNHANLNKIMANAPKKNFVKRPMKAAYKSGCDKITVEGIDADKKALVISFSKYGDEKALKRYAGQLLMRVFPALGAQYAYSAVADDGKFDAFTIMDYVNKDTWCEYALSKYVKRNVPQFTKSFKAMAALSAVEL